MIVIAAVGWVLAVTFLLMWRITEHFRLAAHDGWRKSLEERRVLIGQLEESLKRERKTLLAYLGDRAIRSALVGEPWEDK